jgi:hypothetical protein
VGTAASKARVEDSALKLIVGHGGAKALFGAEAFSREELDREVNGNALIGLTTIP